MKYKTILLSIALTSGLNAGVDDATSQAGRTIGNSCENILSLGCQLLLQMEAELFGLKDLDMLTKGKVNRLILRRV